MMVEFDHRLEQDPVCVHMYTCVYACIVRTLRILCFEAFVSRENVSSGTAGIIDKRLVRRVESGECFSIKPLKSLYMICFAKLMFILIMNVLT